MLMMSGRKVSWALAAAILASLQMVSATLAHHNDSRERFRLLFDKASSSLPVAGPHVESNTAALSSLLTAFERWGLMPGSRLLFVAENHACDSNDCQADAVTWIRVRNAMTAIKRASSGSQTVSFQTVGFAFANEHGVGETLPQSPEGMESITLFIARGAVTAKSPASCKIRLTIQDPTLPPILGEKDGHDGLTVEPGAMISRYTETRFRVEGQNGPVRLDWEDAKGTRFPSTPGDWINANIIPSKAVALYILPAEKPFEGDADMRGSGNNVSGFDPKTVRQPRPGPRSIQDAQQLGPAGACYFRFTALP